MRHPSTADVAIVWAKARLGALRSDRPKHRRASLRASVSSDRRARRTESDSLGSPIPEVNHWCVLIQTILLANYCGWPTHRNLGKLGPSGVAFPGHQRPRTNSPTVTYAVYAAPGMMKMESGSGSPEDWRRVSGRRPFDQLRASREVRCSLLRCEQEPSWISSDLDGKWSQRHLNGREGHRRHPQSWEGRARQSYEDVQTVD
jgi:hypothetical protein